MHFSTHGLFVLVKLLATIQMTVLLATSVVPCGRMSEARVWYGCSASERSTGTCCCSSGATTCCSGTDNQSNDSQRSCCRKTIQQRDQAAGKPSRGCRFPQQPANGVQSTCPCGAPSEQAIMTMPRLQTQKSSSPGLAENGPHVLANPRQYGQTREAPGCPPPLIV